MSSDVFSDFKPPSFATQVALSSDGMVVAIGSPGFDHGSNVDSGLVRAFAYDGSVWTQRGSDIFGESADDQLGGEKTSVALNADGSRLAAGAWRSDDGLQGLNAGRVRVWELVEIPGYGVFWYQLGHDIDGLVLH